MTYHQRLLAEIAEEQPSYFMCGKKSADNLIKKARREAETLLNDFRLFYSGKIDIVVKKIEWGTCWSIGATLTVNGETCREYDDVDLCFLDLNTLMLNSMIKNRSRINTDTNGGTT